MSDALKRYPADTPVTLQMLRDIFSSMEYKLETQTVSNLIEPPKPEPKKGELWLCRSNRNGDLAAFYCNQRGWAVWKSDQTDLSLNTIIPIKRLIPAEGSDE